MLRLTGETFYWWSRFGMDYPALLTILLIAVFAFGACWGSFLNVCIWRLPLGESVVTAPSHCTKCHYEIRWFDNIPIFSYLWLRGRCRNCREPYSCRYLVVEALTGTLFTLLYCKIGLAGENPALLLFYWTMTMLCITTGWIDAEHRLIPDATTIPAFLLALLYSVIFPSVWGKDATWWTALLFAVFSAAAAGGFLGAFALIGRKLTGRDVIGWGDVKFLTATAALLGLPGAFFTLFAGSVTGSIYGVVLARIRHRPLRRTRIAFGPFLAAGALLWMFAGEFLLKWYLQFVRFCALAQ